MTTTGMAERGAERELEPQRAVLAFARLLLEVLEFVIARLVQKSCVCVLSSA